MEGGLFLNKFGEIIYQYRKSIFVLWAVIIVGLSYFSYSLPGVLWGDGFEYDGEAKKVKQILHDEFGQPDASIIVLFEKNSEEVTDPVFQDHIKNVLTDFGQMEQIQSIVSPLEQPNMNKGSMAFALLHFDKDPRDLGPEIEELRKYTQDNEYVRTALTGEPLIIHDMNEASQKDLQKAEMFGLPVALFVLILAFGGLVAASIPLMIGVITILTTMGILYFFGLFTNLSIFVLNVVPMIGLALSIDFALLMINRFKEEIETKPIPEAIGKTVTRAGHSIIISSATVAISMASMMFFELDIFKSVALGGMFVVLVSALASVTLLPAFLCILGPRINRFPIIKIKKVNAKENVWWKLSTFVMKRPGTMAILASVILLIGAYPAKDLQLAIPSSDALPPSYESRIAMEQFEDVFGREGTSEITLVIEGSGDILGKASLERVETILNELENDKLVQETESLFSMTGAQEAEELYQLLQAPQVKDQLAPAIKAYTTDDKMLVNVYLDAPKASKEARDWSKEWSEKEFEVTVLLGGYAKYEQEIFGEVYSKLPYALLTVIGATFLIIMLAFKSIAIPVKAILMNVLSLGTTFGLLVLIFRDEPIILVIPVFMVVALALSVDYEVFLVSRIHEVYQETRDNDQATLFGLASTSKLITSAGLIMISVFAAFGFTEVTTVKQLGIGLALAIALDITIVRLLLVPALLKLMGDWNWWFFGLGKKKELGR
jgi:RND superfamily putative drug exporter